MKCKSQMVGKKEIKKKFSDPISIVDDRLYRNGGNVLSICFHYMYYIKCGVEYYYMLYFVVYPIGKNQ